MRLPTLATGLLLALSPGLALADEMLERLEVANEAAADQLVSFYEERLPEHTDKIPDFSWDAETREASACVLDNIRTVGGDQAVEAYVKAAEAWAAVKITSLDTIAQNVPAVLVSPLAIELGQRCGASEIAISKMEASGFSELMKQPGILERLK
ncbi:hypothetical protein ACOXXX_13635 [Thalassococcus sp. BH17M4-6]|uniref:hypothetical protein n=1 Tax=Thalassococcus sp. BH17M4-6 TaxID=3413148 RepID=UPI003BEC54F0